MSTLAQNEKGAALPEGRPFGRAQALKRRRLPRDLLGTAEAVGTRL